jgi:hypothetical protein
VCGLLGKKVTPCYVKRKIQDFAFYNFTFSKVRLCAQYSRASRR